MVVIAVVTGYSRYEAFVEQHGGTTGGWDDADHSVYLKLAKHYEGFQVPTHRHCRRVVRACASPDPLFAQDLLVDACLQQIVGVSEVTTVGMTKAMPHPEAMSIVDDGHD